MNDFLTMFVSNYKTQIKIKSYKMVTLLVGLALLLVLNIDRIYEVLEKEHASQIIFLTDNSETKLNLEHFISSNELEGIDLHGSSHPIVFVENSEEAKQMLAEEEGYEYILSFESGENNELHTTVISLTDSHNEELGDFENFIMQFQNSLFLRNLELTEAEYSSFMPSVTIHIESIESIVKDSAYNTANIVFIYSFIVIFYFTVIIYASQLASSVATEKSARVIELVVTSISPTKYLFAKILSALAAALTQIASWIFVALFGLKYGEYERLTLIQDFTFEELKLTTLLVALILYILGFVLYGSLSCLIGSLMTKPEEASQATLPVALFLLVAFYMGMNGLTSPNTTEMAVGSYIPFLTPILALIRIVFIDINFIEVILVMGSLIIFTILAVIISANVFKGGILIQSEGSFKNIRKALKM